MMINLFECDKSLELEEQAKELRSYFLNRCSRAAKPDPIIQLKINKWLNLLIYQQVREDSVLAIKVNERYHEYKNNIDTKMEVFVKNFPNECFSRMFELAMADLKSQKYVLKSRDLSVESVSLPDLDCDLYFTECTTMVTSIMDKWDKMLIDFDKYIRIMKVFFNKLPINKQTGSNAVWYYDGSIRKIWDSYLSAEEKYYISHELIFLNIKNNQIVDVLCDWIFKNRYACFYFSNIIPEKILNDLRQLGLVTSSIANEKIDYNFYARRVAIGICDKLKKIIFIKNPEELSL
ncbi:MAG TPA: hypothetical protein VHZ76_05595 [Gammaproteobacteria bacterium]|jgi:hypothetical protein|nr:hypothetical protein [Gammaproteobacteria bacterium]